MDIFCQKWFFQDMKKVNPWPYRKYVHLKNGGKGPIAKVCTNNLEFVGNRLYRFLNYYNQNWPQFKKGSKNGNFCKIGKKKTKKRNNKNHKRHKTKKTQKNQKRNKKLKKKNLKKDKKSSKKSKKIVKNEQKTQNKYSSNRPTW